MPLSDGVTFPGILVLLPQEAAPIDAPGAGLVDKIQALPGQVDGFEGAVRGRRFGGGLMLQGAEGAGALHRRGDRLCEGGRSGYQHSEEKRC